MYDKSLEYISETQTLIGKQKKSYIEIDTSTGELKGETILLEKLLIKNTDWKKLTKNVILIMF